MPLQGAEVAEPGGLRKPHLQPSAPAGQPIPAPARGAGHRRGRRSQQCQRQAADRKGRAGGPPAQAPFQGGRVAVRCHLWPTGPAGRQVRVPEHLLCGQDGGEGFGGLGSPHPAGAAQDELCVKDAGRGLHRGLLGRPVGPEAGRPGAVGLCQAQRRLCEGGGRALSRVEEARPGRVRDGDGRRPDLGGGQVPVSQPALPEMGAEVRRESIFALLKLSLSPVLTFSLLDLCLFSLLLLIFF